MESIAMIFTVCGAAALVKGMLKVIDRLEQ